MKQIVTFLFVVIPITLSAEIYEGRTGSCTYSLNTETFTLTIAGEGKMRDYSENNKQYHEYADYINIVKIEEGVTNIGNAAFQGLTKLKDITIPNSVVALGNNVFDGCTSLQSISLPNSINVIGNYAFQGCSNLLSIKLSDECTSLGQYVFKDCNSLTSIKIPEKLMEINENTFANCTGLKTIKFPKGLKSIGKNAFSSCTGLVSIAIPDSVTTIDDYAFYYCTGLTSVKLPKRLQTIGKYAFSNSKSLKSIIIPEGVISIGSYAFSYCENLELISIPSTITNLGNAVFRTNFSLKDVYCFLEDYPKSSEVFYNTNADAIKNTPTLHVVSGLESVFSKWGFRQVVALTDKDYDLSQRYCSLPTIEYVNGVLKFSCDTENVTFVTDISSQDINTFFSSEIPLTFSYDICVYATKERCVDSEMVYATITWKDGKIIMEGITNAEPEKLKGDVNEDGAVDINDVVNIINIMAGQSE